jgi:hypothetical protein
VLPLGLPGETALVSARTDFVASATARLGYAADRWLLYVKGGAAWAGDKYDVTGMFTGIPFSFEGLDQRVGWVAGGGVDWALISRRAGTSPTISPARPRARIPSASGAKPQAGTPSTMRCRAAKAETMWIASFEPFF